MRRERRHALEAGAARAVEMALRPLPRSLALRLGSAAGGLLGRLSKRHVGIAQRQLQLSFPDWSAQRCRETAHGVYRHLGRILFDILWLGSRPPEAVLGLVDFEGREHAQRAEAMGRGVVYVAGHVGNWEVNGIAHAAAVRPIGVVARPLDNARLDAHITRFRASTGNTVISKRRALPDILRLLRSGRGVAFLIDQNTQLQDGVFVEFFGRPACSTPVAATLAVRTGAVLVAGHTELRPDGRYRQSYDPPTEWTSSGSRERDILDLTQRLNSQIEAWVRRVPDQWLWIHRRWHTQPPDAGAAREAQP